MKELKELFKNALTILGEIMIAVLRANVFNYGVQLALIQIMLT